jgi:hypothetical protein
VICGNERKAVNLRRNAVDDQLASVCQSILQHDLEHRVRRHETALDGALPIGQVSSLTLPMNS